MDPELSKNLTNCGIKKSVIESTLKLPKNSLSGMINGTRPTPKKTEEKLQKFIDDLLIETVKEAAKNSTETSIPNGAIITGPIVDMVKNPLDLVSEPRDGIGPKSFHFPENSTEAEMAKNHPSYNQDNRPKIQDEPVFKAPRPWIKKIEDYCGIAGITPEELIEQHAIKSSKITIINTPKEEKNKDILPAGWKSSQSKRCTLRL